MDPEDLFTKQERIGKGSFGEVYKGIDKRTQKTIAIKIINLEEAEDEIEDIQQEITVLSQCDSCFITKYIGSYIKASVCHRCLLIISRNAGLTRLPVCLSVCPVRAPNSKTKKEKNKLGVNVYQGSNNWCADFRSKV